VRQQTWETPEGQKRHKHEVVADRVHFLGLRSPGAAVALGEADTTVEDEEDLPL
jgi:hypothetical protein